MAEPIEMVFGLWAGMNPKNQKLDGAKIPPQKRAILGERGAHYKV